MGVPCLARINVAVGVVIFIFVTLYCTAIFGVVIPKLSLSVPGVMHLGVLTVLTALALFSYCCCVFLNPGSVPDGWVPDAENLSQTFEVKRKGQTARYCQKCEQYKPPRAHHCRVCNRCVLRMDHHCVWINNCVGHNNYKSFILFLIYTVAALIHLILILGGAVVETHRDTHQLQRTRVLAVPQKYLMLQFLFSLWKLVCLTGTMILVTALSMLLAWHVYLITYNKTTIEYHEGVRARGLAKSFTHPYHLGLCGNLHAVLGANPGCWLLPFECAVAGDGVEYQMGEALVTNLSSASLSGKGTSLYPAQAPSPSVDPLVGQTEDL
mmetsp:Transcript_33353/g.72745  ORF Transcript_33353/g.72745 Transcript_33353/m.72745 type:complete len:324 (-) Transcript_33353:1402-2373(-)